MAEANVVPRAEIAFLGSLTMYGKGTLVVGEVPQGRRRIDYAKGGTLVGPEVKAELVGGHDTLLRRHDGTLLADVRLALKLDDGMGLEIVYRGYVNGPAGIGDRILAREALDPATYTIRTHAWFETGSEKYYWLNQTVAFGQGRFTTDAAGKAAMVYDYFRVL